MIKVKFDNFERKTRYIFSSYDETVRFTFGAGSYMVDGMLESEGHVLIGRYCSIARGVQFYIGLNHAMEKVTTYPFDTVNDDAQFRPSASCPGPRQIIIGNDVWIGNDVTIMGGVRIGNGAVIGAGSVVAKDVPPYAVVVGNSARIVRYRFSEEIIQKLQKIKWWYWQDNVIRENYELMRHPEEFCRKFYREGTGRDSSEIAEELAGLRAAGNELYYFIADIDRAAPEDKSAPVWENVIQQYMQQVSDKSPEILLVEIPDSKYAEVFQANLAEILSSLGDRAPAVYTHSNMQEVQSILQNIDCFITSRDGSSSAAVDYAWDYGVRIKSGLDDDLFAGSLCKSTKDIFKPDRKS